MIIDILTPDEIKSMAIDSTWQRIEYELTDEAIAEIEKQYAETCLEIDQLEIEKRNASSHFGSLIKNADTRREELRQQIVTKRYLVDTNLYLVPDHERDVMRYFDVKTGRKIKERPLENYERQQSTLEDFAVVESGAKADGNTPT